MKPGKQPFIIIWLQGGRLDDTITSRLEPNSVVYEGVIDGKAYCVVPLKRYSLKR